MKPERDWRAPRRTGRPPHRGRKSVLVLSVLFLTLGVGSSFLWWSSGNGAPPAWMVFPPATLGAYGALLYLGWGDDRRGSPGRYWATAAVLVAGVFGMVLYGLAPGS